ncbi:MAG: hypothetical protein JXB13_13620 [Phycisphaerae bacterium]|nr:hypothetical protein [Phycisphaerae bacterium]
MAEFRHYILTRFNTGLYGPNARARIDPREWIEHRIRLFTGITLPSIAGQTCQDFTWLVLMDRQTPDPYCRTLEASACRNMKLIFLDPEQPRWLRDFAPGRYDLITTRLDNDDAFHRDTIRNIQDTWRAEAPHRAKPWLIICPFGLILDLADRQMWVMEYWFNNCPTLVEDSEGARTVHRWQHSEIPMDVPRQYIQDKPCWLQVVHSQNLLNAIDSNNPQRIVHKELPGKLEFLRHFGIDPGHLPPA